MLTLLGELLELVVLLECTELGELLGRILLLGRRRRRLLGRVSSWRVGSGSGHGGRRVLVGGSVGWWGVMVGGGCQLEGEVHVSCPGRVGAASTSSQRLLLFDASPDCQHPSPLPSPQTHTSSRAMAVGAVPDAPFDPSSATSYGDNFYPKQTDPNKTILPPRAAPLTASNLWQAIKVRT